jgi:hypothetical protein
LRRRLPAAVSGALLAVALTAAPAASSGSGGHDATTRILVGDAEQPVVSVLSDGEAVGRFRVRGPAFVDAVGSGRYGYAIQEAADQVAIVDGAPDGPVSLLAFTLEGAEPSHVVAHDGQVAVFNDGDGTVAVFEERALTDSRPQVTTVSTAGPHHGVAVPAHDRVVVTVPDPDDPDAILPVGVEVRDLDDQVLQTFTGCPELHGEIAVRDVIAFGCEDGVLVLRPDGKGFSASKVPNPPDAEEGAHVTVLHGDEDLPYLIGTFGADALLRVDLEEGTATALPLPAPRSTFGLDGQGRAAVLTADGHVHVLEPDGTHAGSVPVIDAFDPGMDWAVLPKLTTAGDAGYVTDARTGEVVEVDLASLQVVERLAVGGQPSSVAVLGQAG